MYQNYQYEVDPKDPLKPLYQGTFEEKVTVGGKERRYLVYIPEGARPSDGRRVYPAGEWQDRR